MLYVFAATGLAYTLAMASPASSSPLPCGATTIPGGTAGSPAISGADVAAAQRAAAEGVSQLRRTPLASPSPGAIPTPPAGWIPPQTGGTPAPCASIAPDSSAGDISAAIYAAALALEGMSTCNVPGTDGGQNACMWAVNQVIFKALGHYVAGGTMYVPTAVAAFDAGAAVQIPQSATVPGDLVVVTSSSGQDMHIGVCMTKGCTDVLSNSSSRCNFSWHSSALFQYPGSPYNGGSAAFYRVTK